MDWRGGSEAISSKERGRGEGWQRAELELIKIAVSPLRIGRSPNPSQKAAGQGWRGSGGS